MSDEIAIDSIIKSDTATIAIISLDLEHYNQLEPQRKVIYDLIMASCEMYPPWKKLSFNQMHKICRKIERSCHNRTIFECKNDGEDRFWQNPLFTAKYSIICAKIVNNIDITSQVNISASDPTYTIKKIITGEFDLDLIANLSSWELNPQCNQAIINEINARKNIKVDVKTSDRKECPKCHERKVTYIETQTRAADEPSSIKYTCTICHNWWY